MISKNNNSSTKLIQCFVNYNESLNEHDSPATTAENPDIFNPNAPSSSAFTATDMHLGILSEIVATTQRTTNTLTPIMEELMKIFSTTPELQTPQANHTGTNELEEVMDFTPSEA
ncbi:LOW QUALITY PROTEIN: hypothetical protein CVT25_000151 [Psilocybe cyanescens]|uniref:Uncharacterized protein n=1 Tax=Psilocybe cyanescens TaxID=93625 RepID=A0A409XRV3_PSICY|nr:LOW QUALITY PROTEIN: hypothetical protein CVT25_000151 [Psilocybe cyanescens]